MNRFQNLVRVLLLVLACLLSLTCLTSCDDETSWTELSDDSDADVLCRTFIDHVIREEREDLYDLVKHMVDSETFETIWRDLRTVADGAASADIHQTHWEFFTDSSGSYLQSSYMVEYDTGASMSFHITTGETKGVPEGFGFTETTGFLANATKASQIWNTVLIGVSLLVLAFTIWMLVDCIRRPLKRKALWIILILLGISLTFTVGPESAHLNFFVGIFAQFSTSTLNMAMPAMIIRVIIPVGPIIYFCVRKRMTVAAEPPMPPDAPVSFGEPTVPSEADSTDSYTL